MGKVRRREVPEHIKRMVVDRDKNCINCLCEQRLQGHHAWYGVEAQRYDPNRNDISRIVALCKECHDKIHNYGDQEIRNYCKQHLINLYGQELS